MPMAARKFGSASRSHARRLETQAPAAERGYDEKWRRLRLAYLKQHWHCEEHLARGQRVRATEVDHMRPFKGPNDPLRLAWKNLRSLCHSCHVKKTHKDKREGRLKK